ncbi:unnamed protein product [Thelazia callipaeda]|uniref:ANK_REP_REGION domain-containing protein n=1 Tax=Thelazia callipaeda TaxID=103827 RepID=A0A158RCN5_THECL|nr:unnamed protein product [Thelazia callipaeda]
MNADLQKAVLLNDLKLVQKYIDKGIDVNDVDENGTSVLHLASFFGFTSIVNALINAHARIDLRDREWFTPLQRACIHDRSETVRLLISRGAKVNTATKQFMTSLHICAQSNSLNCAEVIVNHCDSIIDRSDWAGSTPLHYAAFFGSIGFVKFLLLRGANPNIRNKQGMTAAHMAAYSGYDEILRVLFRNGVDFQSRDNRLRTVLHYASLSTNMNSVRFLVESTSVPLDSQCSEGFTPLHYAVIWGCSRNAEILIKRGAHPFMPSYGSNYIPLHIAAGFTEGTVPCELLLDVTRNLADQSADGSTALHFACEHGRIARTKILLARRVPVNIFTEHGLTPLHMACRHGHDLIVKHLLAAGADCNLKTKTGLTAVHLAAFHGHVSVIRTLYLNGADIEAVDNFGRTALHVATQSASTNSEFMIDYLLTTSISPSKVDHRNCSALHYAARSGFFNAIQKLLGAGARACQQDMFGFTPLHYAVQSPADLALVSTKVLLRADCTVAQIRDKSGFLPVHYAVKAGNLDTTLLLADVVTDVTVPSSSHPYHLSLYHIAANYNHPHLLQKLLAFFHARSMMAEEPIARVGVTIGLETDSLERLPIHYAMARGHEKCVDILLRTAIRKQALLKKDCFGMTAVHAAAACGRIVCITLAVELLREEEINVLDSLLRTPIMLSISNGFLDCFLALLPKSDVTLFDKNGRGFMHRACSLRNEILCKELIQKGADFKSMDCNGVTPFHIAARSGDSATVKYLIANGVAETSDSSGLTPFDWAAVAGNESILHIIQERDQNKNRSLAFLLAASCGRIMESEFILRLNPHYIKTFDTHGRTALHLAARNGHCRLSSTLLLAGADPSTVDNYRVTPLMAAASCPDPNNALEIVGLLVEQGAYLDARDLKGNTVFHYACIAGNEMSAHHLLRQMKSIPVSDQADHIINAQNHRKQTMLHLACRAGMTTLVEDILELSTYSLSLMDDKGRIPLIAPIENEAVADCMLYMLDTFVGALRTDGFLETIRNFRETGQVEPHIQCPPVSGKVQVEREGDFF